MSIRRGNKIIASRISNGFSLFDCKWADHVLNNISWLRADTFSWQSGDVYKAAYEHLADEFRGLYIVASGDILGEEKTYYRDVSKDTATTPINGTPLYAWTADDGSATYTKKLAPSAGDNAFGYTGSPEGTITESTAKSDTIGDITITYYLADDGHKICLPDQESNLSSVYENTGVAWYYIIDLANKQFKLPRTKFGFTGIRSGVGGYVEPGLPNITGAFTTNGATASASSKTGAFYNSGGSNNSSTGGGISGQTNGYGFNASLSNAIYGNSDTVQPQATEMYLYFYVGNYVEDLTTIEVGKLTEVVNDFDIDTFKPQVDEIKNEAILDINQTTSDSVEQLKNMGEVVNYTNITNCITEIPQDIKLEIGSSNQFIVKAGSKVYYGDGSSVTLPSDKSFSASIEFGSEPFVFCIKKSDLSVMQATLNNTSSNATNPGVGYRFWFNTTDGKCYVNDGSGVATETSFPVGIAQHTNNVGWTSIEQVFNGFGYIGPTVFALPGVKALVPNGRNADGTLNNIPIETTTVSFYTALSTLDGRTSLSLLYDGTTTNVSRYLGGFQIVDSLPTESKNWARYYIPAENYIYTYNGDDADNRYYIKQYAIDMFAGTMETETTAPYKIKSLKPRNTFEALDVNIFQGYDYVVDWQMPTADNNYTWYRKYKSGWVEQGGKDSTGSGTKTVTLPIVMKDSNYTILTTTQSSNAAHNAVINGGTTTSFTVVKSNTICYWQVSGYAA